MQQRFGDDMFERIERDGAIQVTWNLRERGRITWSLEKQVQTCKHEETTDIPFFFPGMFFCYDKPFNFS